MATPAQVRSTDALDAFVISLARFEDRVQAALDALDGELRRADAWIDHDRPAHWRKQIREAEGRLHDAKLDLERCLLMTVVEGQRPACREQKAAVQQAKAHLEYCREKAQAVKKWQRNFGHESLEFHGRLGQLRRAIEQDAPAARAVLGKLLRRLEEYRLERPPEAASLKPAAAGDDAAPSHARDAGPAADAPEE